MGPVIARLLGGAPAEDTVSDETTRIFSRASAEQLDLLPAQRDVPMPSDPPGSGGWRAAADAQEQAFQSLLAEATAVLPAALWKELIQAQRACETAERHLTEARAHRDTHEARQPRQSRDVFAKQVEVQAAVQAFERMAHAQRQALADVTERARQALAAYVTEQAAALDAERREAEAAYQRRMAQARADRNQVRVREMALSRLARTVTEADATVLGDLLRGGMGGR